MSKNLNNDAMDPPAEVDKEQNATYCDREENAINALKKLSVETFNLDLEVERKMFVMEKFFERRYHAIHDRRMKFLEELKKTNNGDVSPKFTTFWLQVLKASFAKYISDNDQKVLAHLLDVRLSLYIVPDVKFVIEFHFEENSYIEDSLLTKSYYLNCSAVSETKLIYCGAQIYKAVGCNINWKDKSQNYATNFFAFFAPPELPKRSDANYDNICNIIHRDYKFGIRFKEHIIPKAVLIFTGEIKGVQSDTDSDSTSDSDSDYPFDTSSLDFGEEASSLP